MSRSRTLGRLALVAAAFTIAACSDQVAPTAPSSRALAVRPTESSGDTNPLSSSLQTITAVQWYPTHDTQQTYVASRRIGAAGGTLSIPEADFTITFPAGALAGDTTITITAQSGPYVSYDMQPHGIQFAQPVLVTQGLLNTYAYRNPVSGLLLFGAYLPTDDLLGAGGVLTGAEIQTSKTQYAFVPGQLFPVPVVERWIVHHFSRYMLASG